MGAGRYVISAWGVARSARWRWQLGLTTMVLSCSLVGCGGKSVAPHPVSTASIAESLVNGELAVYFPDVQSAPPPGPVQRALLNKAALTFADYRSAMQAAADCIEQRDPGASATLQLVPGWQQIYHLQVLGTTASPSGREGSSNARTSSSESAAITPPAAGSTPITLPPNVVREQAIQGYCIATYSARVEARWRVMQILTGSQLAAQRDRFLQCMQPAGITVAPRTSNEQLGRIFNDPTTYAKLSPKQMQQSNTCTSQFQQFLFSISPP